jgi:hypothetical protein
MLNISTKGPLTLQIPRYARDGKKERASERRRRLLKERAVVTGKGYRYRKGLSLQERAIVTGKGYR